MKTAIYITLATGLCLQVFYFSEYPESVANHFAPGGIANGWMPKATNLFVSMAAVLINSATFLAIPHILKNVPVKFVSFPKKAFWLAPERKETSISLISNWMYFIGLLTNILLISIFHMVYMANQEQTPALNESAFLILLSVYAVALVTWLLLLFRRFNKASAH